jgi:hypothetical protein
MISLGEKSKQMKDMQSSFGLAFSGDHKGKLVFILYVVFLIPGTFLTEKSHTVF